MPTISVCVPSYNHIRWVRATLDSVLSQSFWDFEVVVSDDGSTDGTYEAAKEYEARDPRVRVVTHEGRRNLGISETVNRAFSEVGGRYWCGLPSDDLLTPGSLERRVRLLDSRPDVQWSYGYALCIDGEGRPLPERGRFVGVDVSGAANPAEHIICENVVAGMTATMRVEATRDLRHEPGLVYSDWRFWVQLAARHRPYYHADGPLNLYRCHSYNTSGAAPAEVAAAREVALFDSLKGLPELGPLRARTLLALQTARAAWGAGDEVRALREVAWVVREGDIRAAWEWFTRWPWPDFTGAFWREAAKALRSRRKRLEGRDALSHLRGAVFRARNSVRHRLGI